MRHGLKIGKPGGLLPAACIGMLAWSTGTAGAALYSDNFDDNTNTGWTYLDRSGGTALMPDISGGPGSPSFSETGGRLEQTVTNYAFPRDAPGSGDPSLGAIALSGSGVITANQYEISVLMDSLENGNVNQDQSVVFAYEDEDNFYYVTTLGNSFRLNQVDNGENTLLYNSSAGYTFSHDPTTLIVKVDTITGTVTSKYGAAAAIVMDTGLTIADGLNGVGSNNDAFAIDDFVVTPEPSSLALLGLGSLLVARRRRL